jgi:hypothetical protein
MHYLALLQASNRRLDGDELDALAARAPTIDLGSQELLLASAKVLAQSGDSDTAAKLYLLLASGLVKQQGLTSTEEEASQTALFNGLELVREIQPLFGAEQQRELLTQLATMFSGAYTQPELWPMFNSFVIEASRILFEDSDTLSVAQAVLKQVARPGAMNLPTDVQDVEYSNVHQLPQAMSLIALNISLGHYDDAFAALEGLVQANHSQADVHANETPDMQPGFNHNGIEFYTQASTLGLPYSLYVESGQPMPLEQAFAVHARALFPPDNVSWINRVKTRIEAWQQQGMVVPQLADELAELSN